MIVIALSVIIVLGLAVLLMIAMIKGVVSTYEQRSDEISGKVAPFLNLFNGYSCGRCKMGLDKDIEICENCKCKIDWEGAESPDVNKKHRRINHFPEYHD